ncbi:MAG: DUF6282 family protein [Candidatus Bathyarchaeia archaeon]
MRLEKIVRCAIDMHVHVGPECIVRKYDAMQFAREALRRGIAGAVLKSHFQSTSDWAYLARKHGGAKFFGAVVLNRHVGGLNPYAVRAALGPRIGDEPLLKVVWMPTIHSKSHLAIRAKRGDGYDVPTEWGGAAPGCGRRASEIEPVEVMAEGAKPALEEILNLIKEFDLVLATGHLHWEEAELLFERAKERGLEKILMTHPLYEAVDMPLERIVAISKRGGYIEQSYALNLIDGIPIRKMAECIEAVGPDRTILTSDLGQATSPSPPAGLLKFFRALQKEGIDPRDIRTMACENPRALLG